MKTTSRRKKTTLHKHNIAPDNFADEDILPVDWVTKDVNGEISYVKTLTNGYKIEVSSMYEARRLVQTMVHFPQAGPSMLMKLLATRITSI